MITPFEQLESQLSRTDQQLQYYMILEQRETNRLLRLLTENKQETEPIQPEKSAVIEFDSMKRPELMRKMSSLLGNPSGWQKWSNAKMLEHLKGVS